MSFSPAVSLPHMFVQCVDALIGLIGLRIGKKNEGSVEVFKNVDFRKESAGIARIVRVIAINRIISPEPAHRKLRPAVM